MKLYNTLVLAAAEVESVGGFGGERARVGDGEGEVVSDGGGGGGGPFFPLLIYQLFSSFYTFFTNNNAFASIFIYLFFLLHNY